MKPICSSRLKGAFGVFPSTPSSADTQKPVASEERGGLHTQGKGQTLKCGLQSRYGGTGGGGARGAGRAALKGSLADSGCDEICEQKQKIAICPWVCSSFQAVTFRGSRRSHPQLQVSRCYRPEFNSTERREGRLGNSVGLRGN